MSKKTIATNHEQVSNQQHASILTKISAGYFRISISAASQSLIWKTISDQQSILLPSRTLDNVFATISLILWCLTLCMLVLLSLIYTLKCILHFKIVKSECHHHVGISYLYAPLISWLLLLQSTPLFIFPKKHIYEFIWWLLIIPLVALDVKTYGQWFTTEKRFLSIMANPTIQLSVIGNFVGSHAVVETKWTEIRICLFTIGMTHYLVVFITLYQRLSGNNHIPSEIRPVFFLFVATPSMATLTWKSINGSFDTLCKMLFYLALFLLISLDGRPVFFKKSMKKFSVTWWEFLFSLSFLALASIAHAQQLKEVTAVGLALLLSAISMLVFVSLLVFSILKIQTLVNKPIPSFSTASLGSTNV